MLSTLLLLIQPVLPSFICISIQSPSLLFSFTLVPSWRTNKSDPLSSCALLPVTIGETIIKQEVFLATRLMVVKISGVSPTCTASGISDGYYCSVCGDTLIKQEVILTTGHVAVKINSVSPTCMDPGLTDVAIVFIANY